jgi:hypothetical protein
MRRTPTDAPRATPYRDYLAFIAAQDRPAAIAAWRAALAGLDEGTRLAPPDRARAPVAPEQIALALDATLTAALTGLARRRGVTLNTLIQAAWAILLGRLTGRADVVFGVTVAGRPPEIAGIERMVGLFINTLPLRLKLAPSTPLAELLDEVQERQSRLMAIYLGLADQQLAGLGGVRHADRVRELSMDLHGGGGRRRAVPQSARPMRHYGTLRPCRGSSGCGCYRPDLFDRATVELAGRLVRLLAAAAGDPERPIGALDILAPPSGACATGTTARAFGGSLPELVAAQAARRQAVAVVGGRRPSAAANSGASTGWRITCARSAPAPRPSWACASSARSTWWLRSSVSSRPAPPTCRSIPTIRTSGWRSCWPTPPRRSSSPTARCASASPLIRPASSASMPTRHRATTPRPRQRIDRHRRLVIYLGRPASPRRRRHP